MPSSTHASGPVLLSPGLECLPSGVHPPIEIPGLTKVAAWHERTYCDPGHCWARVLIFETCGTVA